MKKIILLIILSILLLTFSNSFSTENYEQFIPIIKIELDKYWSSLCIKEVIPAQIEQESNWNIYAERKVGKEYGFGLSQTTIVKGYFNNFIFFKRKWKEELKNWTWENRFEPVYHIRVMILYDKSLYNKFKFIDNNFQRLAFTLSAYNGGIGWVLKDMKLTQIKGKDRRKWFCNVELYSKRNRTAFIINRKYVRNILLRNIFKYRNYFKNNIKRRNYARKSSVK